MSSQNNKTLHHIGPSSRVRNEAVVSSGLAWTSWSETGPPGKRSRWVFSSISPDHHFRIPDSDLRRWVPTKSNCRSQLGVEGQSTAHRRRGPNHIVVDETVIRITVNDTGCTPLSIQIRTNSSTSGRFRPERRNSLCCSHANSATNNRSSRPRFLSMERTISELRWTDLHSDSGWDAVEIGTPSNVSLER